MNLEIGDIVKVDNIKLKSHKMRGIVEAIRNHGLKDLVTIKRSDNKTITVNRGVLVKIHQGEKLEDKKSTFIFLYSDDHVPMNISDITLQSFIDLTGLEGSTAELLYGDRTEIITSLKDDLDSWECVYGLCDNKPFVMRRDYIIEGLD